VQLYPGVNRFDRVKPVLCVLLGVPTGSSDVQPLSENQVVDCSVNFDLCLLAVSLSLRAVPSMSYAWNKSKAEVKVVSGLQL